jgi:D-glycero-alpha-D-manno-heptose-7-phosphate kinase
VTPGTIRRLHPCNMSACIRDILLKGPVEASAPCRVDSGGTWDIKAMALPLQGVRPVTLNLALTLRTGVTLLPLQPGYVGLSSEGFSNREVHPFRKLPFDSSFGIFFAAVSHFGFHGVEVHIRSDSPVKSALGGSSTALVALVKALSKVSGLKGGKEMTAGEVLHLAYHLEDAVSSGKCGIQDQAAAAYGGVHLWEWRYGERGSFFTRTALLDRKAQRELSARILVAYSGKSHVSSRINQAWLKGFLSGRTRAGWVKANDRVRGLAGALRGKDWNRAARLLREEMAIRREITPDALIPITGRLIDQAEAAGCGARFAGAGGGGAVWALGGLTRIKRLREIWRSTLTPIPGARLLECGIDPRGVI